ncbi:MAG: serine/threonine-protein kinase [Pseudomonadota bacterium]
MSEGDDAARLKRLKTLFAGAVAVSEQERARYLDEACGDDPSLRAELESLLAHESGANEVIDEVVADAAATLAAETISGRRLGPYRVLRELGHGGMGTVWLAVRADGQYEKQVAIKLVRALPGRQVLERFEAERRILATLDHPNIARLLDAGTTEDGTPYVVMEYVEGLPVDRYCRERDLDRRAILTLFLQICSAVEHAHRNLIVHRDIKPGNILVDDDNSPKLLDFGIAKLLEPSPATGPAVETVSAMRLLTPEYASPEQVRGEPITTASDVYSLGVLLYQLLTQRSPYEGVSDRPQDLERAICFDEPARMEDTVEQDLENVVRMALRKEPDRRYASVAHLSSDVQRYLEGRAVSAQPATLTYRARKFVSRNRLAIAMAGAVVLAIGATVATYTYRLAEQRDIAARERDIAQREREAAEEVTAFLVDAFELADPDNTRGRTITAEEVLHAGAERIRQDLTDRPALRARLLYTIGGVYEGMGLYEEAGALVSESVALSRDRLGGDHVDLTDRLNLLAKLYFRTGDYAQAREIMLRLVSIQEQAQGPRHRRVAQLLNNLAILDKSLGDFEGARDRYLRAYDILEDTVPPDDPSLGKLLGNLAVVYKRLGDDDAALALYERSVAAKELALGPDHPVLITTLNNFGSFLGDVDQYDRAQEVLGRALQLARSALGEDHPETGFITHNVGILYCQMEDLEGCEAMFARSLEIMEASHGPASHLVAGVLHDYGELRRAQGRLEESEAFYVRALTLRVSALGAEHPDTRLVRDSYVDLLRFMGRHREADALEQSAVSLRSGS